MFIDREVTRLVDDLREDISWMLYHYGFEHAVMELSEGEYISLDLAEEVVTRVQDGL